MRLIPVLKREAVVLATLYDLACPFSPLHIFPHVYYLEPNLAKLLYAKHLLDRRDAWDEVFEAILRDASNEITEILRSVEVYRWESIREVIEKVARGVLELHEEFVEKFICYTQRIFGFNQYFGEVYLVLGFNPLLRTCNGNAMGNIRRFPVVACFVNDLIEHKVALDVIYHEILHRLIQLNGLELSDKIQEVLLEFMCPEGYLSELIGLSKRRLERHLLSKYEWFKREYELLGDSIEEYFKNRIYEQMTIIGYLKDSLKMLRKTK